MHSKSKKKHSHSFVTTSAADVYWGGGYLIRYFDFDLTHSKPLDPALGRGGSQEKIKQLNLKNFKGGYKDRLGLADLAQFLSVKNR